MGKNKRILIAVVNKNEKRKEYTGNRQTVFLDGKPGYCIIVDIRRQSRLFFLLFVFISSISGSARNPKTIESFAVRKQKMGVIKEKRTRSESASADISCLSQQCINV